jgi:hypothetical protein
VISPMRSRHWHELLGPAATFLAESEVIWRQKRLNEVTGNSPMMKKTALRGVCEWITWNYIIRIRDIVRRFDSSRILFSPIPPLFFQLFEVIPLHCVSHLSEFSLLCTLFNNSVSYRPTYSFQSLEKSQMWINLRTLSECSWSTLFFNRDWYCC